MIELSENQRRLLGQKLNVISRDDRSNRKGLLDDVLVDGVCELVDHCGILDKIAEWRQESKRLGGRPAVYGEDRDRLIVVIMLALLMTGQSRS